MKIKLWCSFTTHDLDSKTEELFDPEDLGFTEDEIIKMNDKTKELLEESAKEFFWNDKELGWGFEIIKD